MILRRVWIERLSLPGIVLLALLLLYSGQRLLLAQSGDNSVTRLAQNTTTVALQAPGEAVPLGAFFPLTLTVSQLDAPLSAFQFDLAYDSALIAFRSTNAGGFLADSGREVICPLPEASSGGLRMACASTGSAPGPLGNGLLTVLTFEALADGVSDLTLSGVQLADTDRPPSLIPAALQHGQVTIGSGPPPTATPAPTITPTPTPIPGDDTIYISASEDGAAGSLTMADEDILHYDMITGLWTMLFDGSDVGLADTDVNTFALLADNSIVLSFDSPTFDLPGVGIVEDSDLVRFVPTSLGEDTAGSFQFAFDGSDVGLEADGEGIDTLYVLPNRRLIMGTSGSFDVGSVSGEDEDLLVFTPTSFGGNTSGTWLLAFDGSDVGLADSDSEDIWGLWVDLAALDIYLTTEGLFDVPGSSGDGDDLFICHLISYGNNTACTFGPGLYWNGAAAGLSAGSTDGFAIQQMNPLNPDNDAWEDIWGTEETAPEFP